MRTERYVSSSFANSPVCVANARVIYPGKSPDLWGLLNRDFRYGPIAAPVTASTEPPVPSARSSTRPTTSTTVILPNAGACAGPLLAGLGTPIVLCKDTGAAPPPAAQFPYSLSRTLAQVGCHASRSMRVRIWRKSGPVKLTFGELLEIRELTAGN